MMNIVKKIKINDCISAIKFTSSEIHILDSNFLVYIYSKEDFIVLNKHLLTKRQDNRHAYDRAYAIGGDICAYISDSNSSKGCLFTLKDNKVISKDVLAMHDNLVSVSTFSNDSKILAIGDEDGKAFFYNLDLQSVIFSLAPRADAISSISFSKDSRYTCINSYDKTSFIYDLDTHKELLHVELSDVIEDSIFLKNSSNIAGITRDKKVFTCSSDTKEIIYGDFEFNEWPNIITEIEETHLLVGSRSDTLYLIKLDTLEMIQEIKLDSIGIKTLNIDNSKLYIGYIDGTLEVIDTQYLLEEFENCLKVNKFAKATSLIEKNIFLLTNKAVEKYDKVWEQVLDIAKGHLINKDEQRALKTVKPFFFDKKKKDEYNFLNSNKKDFEHFIKLVETGKDVMAFRYADEFSYLQNTKQYTAIEKKWNSIYQVCKMLFSKDDLESSQKAIDTLTRYAKIDSKKTQINNLITNYKHFIRAQKLVKARNFRLYFILTQKNPFLTEEDLYKKVTQLGHQTYLKLLDLEHREEFEKACSTAKYLLDFTSFKDIANKHIGMIQTKKTLQEFIINDDTDAVYDTISNNKELESFTSFVKYHKIYDDTKHIALQSAKEGNTEDVHYSFQKYFDINYLENSIDIVFKLAYMSEMKKAAIDEFDSIHWLETLRRYTSIYDWDNEVLVFVKEFDLESVIMKSETKFKKELTNKKEFHDSILVYSL